MIKELINFLIQHNMVATIFYKVLYMSIIGSLVGISIFLIRKIFDKKISPKWKCIMWGIFILSLLIPFRFEVKTNLTYENKFINNLDTIPQIAEAKPKEENIQNAQELIESNLIVSEMLEKQIDENLETSPVISNVKEYSLKDIFLLIIVPYMWAFVMIIFILSFILGYLKINKQIKKNRCNDIVVNEILKECLKELNIKRNIKLYYQSYKKSTSIFGIFNSKILISKETLKLDDDSLKYIFMHELAHFKRKDLVLNMVMLLIISIHFLIQLYGICLRKFVKT